MKHLNKAYREVINLKHDNYSKKYVKNYDLYVEKLMQEKKNDNINLTKRQVYVIIELQNKTQDLEESDPIFTDSPAAGITDDDIENWDKTCVFGIIDRSVLIIPLFERKSITAQLSSYNA